MKKQILILIFIFYKIIGFSQSITDIEFYECKVKNYKSEKHEILGINKKVQVYKIKAKIKLQTRTNGMYGTPTIKTRRINYILYTSSDMDSTYRDSVYSEITRYWDKQEKWCEKYNPSGDFSVLPVKSSFFIGDKIIVPYVSTEHQRKGAYSIYWFNNRIFKFMYNGSRKGFGALSSFERESIKFMKNGKEVNLTKFIKNLAEAKKLIKEK